MFIINPSRFESVGGGNSLLTGLVSYWKCDEATNADLADAHGSNTLFDVNNVAAGTGIISSGRDLERSQTEHYAITDATQSGLDITGALSISVWIKPESITGQEGIVAKWLGTPTNDRSYALSQNSDSTLTFLVSPDGTSGNAVSVTTTDTVSVGSWYHVVAVYVPSTSISVYINNGTPATNTTSIPASIYNGAADFWLGMQYTVGSTYAYDGIIDEVGIWSRELSSGDSIALYNSGSGLSYDSFD